MIRILLSLAIAAAAFFGPWLLDQTGTITGAMPGAVVDGAHFADSTVDCFIEQNFSIKDECAPVGGFMGQMVAATIGLGLVSAVLSIIGLLPVVGRVTSIVTLVAGVVAVVTFALFAKDLMMVDGATFTDFRWGGYAVGGFGLLTIFAGLNGLRGDER